MKILLALALLPLAAQAAPTQCNSADGKYSLTAEFLTDGVYKHFYLARIQRSDAKIMALGLPQADGSATQINFSQINQNGTLRVGHGEYLRIDGANSELSLVDDAKVALSCSAQ